MPENVVVLLVIFATFFGALLVGERILDRISPKARPPQPLSPPRPYPGCTTCEGARGDSVSALIRHQVEDHSGAVRWP